MLGRIEGDICSEDLGPCGNDCAARCSLGHGGGKGSCDISSGTPTCMCYYDCAAPPPKIKTCEVALDIGTSGCDNKDCNARCAAKFPSPQDGYGFCYSLPPYISCHCRYKCTDYGRR
ncbi:defensin-like protein 182 [Durio zibethinus]|uniref:Defensin-like protein n=1 Tax=Durio zibethinus TaxID=66656 RepID=A0A6P5XLJ3_DURZI|nr:defensin-like protein 182 [Durio zibethinus]